MFPQNMQTTSGLSILLHGVKSYPDVTSYDRYQILHLCARVFIFLVFTYFVKKSLDTMRIYMQAYL